MPIERRYTFECPECKAHFTYDQPGEPMCTGPGTVDVHQPKVMHRILVKDRDREKHVSQAEGKARAEGTLLMPWTLITTGAKVAGKLWKPKKDDPNWKEEWEELPPVQQAREKFKDDE